MNRKIVASDLVRLAKTLVAGSPDPVGDLKSAMQQLDEMASMCEKYAKYPDTGRELSRQFEKLAKECETLLKSVEKAVQKAEDSGVI